MWIKATIYGFILFLRDQLQVGLEIRLWRNIPRNETYTRNGDLRNIPLSFEFTPVWPDGWWMHPVSSARPQSVPGRCVLLGIPRSRVVVDSNRWIDRLKICYYMLQQERLSQTLMSPYYLFEVMKSACVEWVFKTPKRMTKGEPLFGVALTSFRVVFFGSSKPHLQGWLPTPTGRALLNDEPNRVVRMRDKTAKFGASTEDPM